MIGTGIYTTTGFLVRDLGSAWQVLLAWAVGGVLSCCGALAYGQLATALPFNGGEYQLLSRLYHPAVGFIAGWVSVIAGFSAPLAASSVAFAFYAGRYWPQVPRDVLAIALVWLVTALHLRGVKFSSKVQVTVSSLQVILLASVIGLGLTRALGEHPGGGHMAATPVAMHKWHALGFAHALVYVTFAYSGWNAAVYVAGEIQRPERTLPRALIGATGLVTLLYLLVNVVYLVSAPLSALAGVVDIGAVVAERMYGPHAARAMTLLVCLGLASSVSALTFSGPRVLSAMKAGSARGPRLQVQTNHQRMTLVQSALASVLIVTSSFEALMTYVGIMLSLSTLLALLGVFRLKKVVHCHSPSVLMLVATSLAASLVAWIVIATAISAPASALFTVGTLTLGWLSYRWFGRGTLMETRN
jgi:APA family basic amino acid/polyamine antiporter